MLGMEKKIFLLIVVSLFFIAPMHNSFASVTFGFGGKVKADKISGVTCSGSGTLIILSSNIGGVVNAVSSATSSNNSTGQKVSGAISGIYDIIPFFATNISKKPKVGGWILGKADATIDTSTCKIKLGKTSIPLPVRKTSEYNISGGYSTSSTTSNYSTYTSGGVVNYE